MRLLLRLKSSALKLIQKLCSTVFLGLIFKSFSYRFANWSRIPKISFLYSVPTCLRPRAVDRTLNTKLSYPFVRPSAVADVAPCFWGCCCFCWSRASACWNHYRLRVMHGQRSPKRHRCFESATFRTCLIRQSTRTTTKMKCSKWLSVALHCWCCCCYCYYCCWLLKAFGCSAVGKSDTASVAVELRPNQSRMMLKL